MVRTIPCSLFSPSSSVALDFGVGFAVPYSKLFSVSPCLRGVLLILGLDTLRPASTRALVPAHRWDCNLRISLLRLQVVFYYYMSFNPDLSKWEEGDVKVLAE